MVGAEHLLAVPLSRPLPPHSASCPLVAPPISASPFLPAPPTHHNRLFRGMQEVGRKGGGVRMWHAWRKGVERGEAGVERGWKEVGWGLQGKGGVGAGSGEKPGVEHPLAQ